MLMRICFANGNLTNTATLENILAVSQKTEYVLTIQPSNWTLGHLSQHNENLCLYKTLYISVHTSFIHNSSKLGTAQMPLKGEWLNKQWYDHTWNPTLKRKRTKLIHTTIWMNLKGVMLSEKTANLKGLHTVWFYLLQQF